MHKAFTYKVKDCSVRFYMSTCTLKIFGTEQTTLLNKLHEINKHNKNPSPLPPSKKTDRNGDEDEGSQAGQGFESFIHSIETPSTNEDESLTLRSQDDQEYNSLIDSNEIPPNKEDENLTLNRYPASDFSIGIVMKEISKLRGDIEDVKQRCFVQQEHTMPKQINMELLQCYKEIDDLKNRENLQKVYIQKLEDEKSSLVTTIKILIEERNANESKDDKSTNNLITTTGNDNKNNQTKKTKKTKKGKQNHDNTDKSEGASSSKTHVNDEAVNQDQPSNADKRKTTIIVGDSILSKLHGWKMSDKSNRISIRSFPGSKVDDMKDYIKPSIKCKPNNLILHVGTNNLKLNELIVIAEEIVKMCETIAHESPHTKVAISQLTISHLFDKTPPSSNRSVSQLTKFSAHLQEREIGKLYLMIVLMPPV